MTAVGDARTGTIPSSSATRLPTSPQAHPKRLPDGSAPRVSRAMELRNGWEKRYRRRLLWSDAVIIFVTCAAATVLSLTMLDPRILIEDPLILARIPLVTALTWLISLELFSTRESAAIGTGATEYSRVAQATGMSFGLLAIAFVLFQWEGLRTQILLALPVGLGALVLSRWAWRRWLVRQRSYGQYASRTLVVGDRDDVEYVLRKLGAGGRLGYLVVGTAIDDEITELVVDGNRFAVVGGSPDIANAAHALHADTVIVASQPASDPAFIKRLAWELEGTAADLVLSSRIADVAGPRMSLRPVEGLPLLHVRIPTFEGGAYAFKRALDILTSGLALLVFAPFAALIAIAIKIDSPGPVLFRQTRIGRDGREFKMIKFRSMRTNAEAELAELIKANEGAGPLFKMKHDPRVTRVGRILRKFSLDEVPQFWNVFFGDMSVVGPRPPLPQEVTAYDGRVFRRLYTKPGITGPWQVGGRSDLSWEESVRLDLRYVENWSVLDDLIIMWRTVKVMIRPEGAY